MKRAKRRPLSVKEMNRKIKIEDSVRTAERHEIIELYSSQGITPSATFEDFKCPYKSSCLGTKDKDTWKSGNWAYVGFQYGRAQINGRFVKLFVIAMDRGGYEGSNEQMFEETQFDFRDATETRGNAHMAGVSLILEYLLDEKDKYSIQYSLTNAVKCATKSGNMNAVRQKQVISNCSAHLEREISILKPDIIITQGDHPKQTIRRIFPVNEKEMHFGVVSLWKNEGKIILATPHPARLKGMAYRRGKMPKYFYEAIDEVKQFFWGGGWRK